MNVRTLPNYDKLSLYEKFILRTCFNIPDRQAAEEKGKSHEDLLEESDFRFRKYFGDEIYNQLSGKRVLDLGCGRGNYSAIIARHAKNTEVLGVDLHDQFKMFENYDTGNETSVTEFALANEIELMNQSFDVVLSWNSFEHFENPQEMLNEMKRWCKPGGYLLIKFGPTWMGPYGRHMTNVFRKDRPWFHLFLGEQSIMRVYSVVKGFPELLNKWSEFPDGLNKMTVKKARNLFTDTEGIEIEKFEIRYYSRFKRYRFLKRFNLFRELFSESVVGIMKVSV